MSVKVVISSFDDRQKDLDPILTSISILANLDILYGGFKNVKKINLFIFFIMTLKLTSSCLIVPL